MSFCKLSTQQTLSGLIKKHDVAFKHSCCESALPVRLHPAFNVAHIWRVIYKHASRACWLSSGCPLTHITPIAHCHPAVISPSARNMTASWACVCARVGVRLLSTSSFLSAAAVAATRLYPLCAACESITARWTPDLLVRLSQRGSLHLLAK